MKKPVKIDKVEKSKRIRAVMEWLLDDWSSGDIVLQIISTWDLQERQAKRYLAEARKKWEEDSDGEIEQKRRRKIHSLNRLKRSLKEMYKGTPKGIRSVLEVEKVIIELEGLPLAKKLELTGKDGQPIQQETTIKSNIDYSKLPTEILEALVKARKKADE